MPARAKALVRWRTLSRRVVADAGVVRLERVRRARGRAGAAHDLHVVASGDCVTVVAVTARGRVVLVRQERHGIEAVTLETPGGSIDPGERPAVAAARELREETGYASARLERLGTLHVDPSIRTSRCHVYLARDARRVGEPTLQGLEDLHVVEVARRRLDALVRAGRVTHAVVLGALHLWALRERRRPPAGGGRR